MFMMSQGINPTLVLRLRGTFDLPEIKAKHLWSLRNRLHYVTLYYYCLYTHIYVQYTAGSGWLVRLFLIWTTSIKGRHIKYLTEVCAFSLVVRFWLIWEESYLLIHISMEFTGSRYNGETQNGKWVTEPGHGNRTSGPMDSTAVLVVWLI